MGDQDLVDDADWSEDSCMVLNVIQVPRWQIRLAQIGILTVHAFFA